MKKHNFFYLAFLCILFQGCWPYDQDDDFIPEESQFEPIFLSRTDFDKSVIVKNSSSIGTSGKIYIKDDLLFINELNKGFHVYDNSDPTNPKAVNFLEVPGSTDMAIRSNTIYINQATDLIAMEYSSETNTVSLTKRIPNTFPELRSPDGFDTYYFDIPDNSVVIDWKLKN